MTTTSFSLQLLPLWLPVLFRWLLLLTEFCVLFWGLLLPWHCRASPQEGPHGRDWIWWRGMTSRSTTTTLYGCSILIIRGNRRKNFTNTNHSHDVLNLCISMTGSDAPPFSRLHKRTVCGVTRCPWTSHGNMMDVSLIKVPVIWSAEWNAVIK